MRLSKTGHSRKKATHEEAEGRKKKHLYNEEAITP